jgi:hypothetical protein
MSVPEQHVMPSSDSLRQIVRLPGANGREDPVVRNVADGLGFLSFGLAHGDFFGYDHDVNLPGSATCAEITSHQKRTTKGDASNIS